MGSFREALYPSYLFKLGATKILCSCPGKGNRIVNKTVTFVKVFLTLCLLKGIYRQLGESTWVKFILVV
jgi:hypothetical protein